MKTNMPVNTGISEADRTEIAAGLSRLLADSHPAHPASRDECLDAAQFAGRLNHPSIQPTPP